MYINLRNTVEIVIPVCYLQNLSSSFQQGFWWGLSALLAGMKHQLHVSLVHVLHPNLATESPCKHTSFSENLQMQVHNHNFLNAHINLKVLKELCFSSLLMEWVRKLNCIAYVPALYFILILQKFSEMTRPDSCRHLNYTWTSLYLCTSIRRRVTCCR